MLQKPDKSARLSGAGPPSKLPIAAIAVILVFGAALRIRGIAAQSLWLDESLTWHTATAPLPAFFPTLLANENTPPLYFLIVNLWVKVFGDSDTALRMPSALFGVAGIAGIYWLGREWVGDGVGLLAALFLALSPYHIWYSQEARGYTLLFLLITCSSACLVRSLRAEARWARIGYVIFNALALYAHPFALFALIAQNAYFVIAWASKTAEKRTISLRSWLTLNGMIVVAFAPWIPRAIDLARTGQPWMERDSTIAEALLAYSGSVPLLGLLGTLALVGLCVAIWKRDVRPALPVMLLALPIVAPLAISTSEQPSFHVRYGIVSLLGWLLLAAYGANQLRLWARVVLILSFVILCIPLLSRPGYPEYPGVLVRIDMRSPAQLVAQRASPGDVVLFTESWWMKTVFDRYCPRADIQRAGVGGLTKQVHPARHWLVATPGLRANESITHAKNEGYKITGQHEFEGIALWELRSMEPGGRFE